MRPLQATTDFAAASRRTWEVIVIGAGPAGAMAARELARRGIRVLLVDKCRFPRPKVCGCCLNLRTLTMLASVGLGDIMDRYAAPPLQHLRLAAAGRRAIVPIAGRALSREILDAALVDAAMDAGAFFLPETLAVLEPASDRTRGVLLRREETEVIAQAQIVIGADGLGSRLLAKEPDHQTRIAAGSRLGASAMIGKCPAFFEQGTIYMACSQGGYVGAVRLEDDRLDLAAAFDAAHVKRAGSTGKAAAAVLKQAGFPAIAGLESAGWRGTPLLTRRADPPAAQRVFLTGDAARFVEPFTGEGMAWAMASALAVVPLTLRALGGWQSSFVVEWSAAHRLEIARRQWMCRSIAAVLRRPMLVRLIIPILASFPALAAPIVGFVNGVPQGCREPG
jgi:menaquinone-9 beta-reductase